MEGLGVQAWANQCISFSWPCDWLRHGHLTQAGLIRMNLTNSIGNDEIPPTPSLLLCDVGWGWKVWNRHCHCWDLEGGCLRKKPELRGAQSSGRYGEKEWALWWHPEPLAPVQSFLWILLHEPIFLPFLFFLFFFFNWAGLHEVFCTL